MAKTIFEELTTEHDEMRKMLDTVSEKFTEARFTKLAEELRLHQTAEEKVFYSALISDDATHSIVLEGKEEHHVATLLLKELKSNHKGTDVWMAKLKVLKENVEHHIEEEETELFPAANPLISRDRAIAMTKEFEAEKRAAKAF